MRSKISKNHAIVLTLILVGFIVLFAFPAEADRSHVEFEAALTVPTNTYQYRTTSVYVPPSPESVQYIASFSVLNGGNVKFCTFISTVLWQLWQEGKYEPNWVEGSYGDFGMSGTSEVGEYIDIYLLVKNDGSSSQDVEIWLSKTWHESSKLGLLTGSAVISLGIGILPLLLFGKNRLHLKYSATIFAMAYVMVFSLALAPYESTPPNPVWNFIRDLPGVLFFEAFPLIILLYLLEKNNGFAYFKTWNMKTKLQISGLFLFSGYTLPIWVMLFGMIALLLRLPLDTNQAAAFSSTLGGLLMLTGLVLFIGLWTTQHRRKTFVQL